MQSFIDRVRKSEIPQPTQRTYTQEKWDAGYLASKSPIPADGNLYKAGKWFFAKFESIRNKLAEYSMSCLSKEDRLRIVLGDLNRTCHIISHCYLPVKKKEGYIAEQLIQGKIDKSRLGIAASPDDILTMAIDGAKHVLIYMYQEDSSSKGIQHKDLVLLENEQKIMALAQYHDSLENLWAECLWNGWFVQEGTEIDLVRPSNLDVEILRAVSEYRRQALILQGTQLAVTIWRHRLEDRQRKQLCKRPEVLITGSGKNKIYKVSIIKSDPTFPPVTFIHRIMAQETYFDAILDEPFPRLPFLNLNILFLIWEMLYSLATTQLRYFPYGSSVRQASKFLLYAPLLKKFEIASLINQLISSISIPKASEIIDFLTFKPNSKSELWATPFVEIEKDRIVIVLGPILYGNLLRTIELWMKAGGVDLAERGHLFEVDRRRQLHLEITASKISKDVRIVPHKVVMGGEEIDIVMRICNTILLGEAKCVLFPSEAYNHFSYFQVLKHAAEQIIRKTDTVRGHIGELLSLLECKGVTKDSNVTLVPFVLSNQSLGAGFVVDGIPIVDPVIMSAYLEGNIKHFVEYDGENKQTVVGKTIDFYKTEEEVGKNIESYLKNPPQVEFYKQFTQADRYPLLLLNEGDKKAAFLNLTVKLPIPEANYGIAGT